jgi:diadenosine tetraphosphate (Ap4A) HIT family hydrolase
VAKKLAKALSIPDYNILQNNGRLAHQEVDHVHFHIIPKPDTESGLIIGWPQQGVDMEKLKKVFEEVKERL